MTDPREGYPSIDPKLLRLLREPIKLELISPPSSHANFFSETMPIFKSTTNRPSQSRNNRPRDNQGRRQVASVGVRRNNPPSPPTKNPPLLGSPTEVTNP